MATSTVGSTATRPPSADGQSPDHSLLGVFDLVYYREEKAAIIPDVRKPKVDFFDKPAATPGDQTAHVTTRRNQTRRQRGEHESFELNKDKMNNPSRVREQEADDSEILVIEQIRMALEKDMKPHDPLVVILHNQFLTSFRGASAEPFKIDKCKGEMDIMIIHPKYGIHFVEVKSTRSIDFHAQQGGATQASDNFSPFNKATTQLIRNQTCIQEEMGDLLEQDTFVLTIALPNLKPEDSSVIRREAEERKKKKQTSDITEGTRSTAEEPVVTSAEHAARASTVRARRPEKELLEDHPEIQLLCGSSPEICTKWVERLKLLRASAGPAFRGSTVEERLRSFKLACIRRLSVAGLRPGHSVREGAALHRRFLLTEEQVRVRDSQARLLHVWGPPGSGKTLLLGARARRWVREDRRVALVVGWGLYTALLHQLTRSVCGDKTDGARVSTHIDCRDLLEWLDSASSADPVHVIIDETLRVDYSRLLRHVAEGRVGGVWSAGTADLDDVAKAAWQAEGGTTEQLQLCLRCPPSVMALSNAVGGTWYPPLLPPPVPVTRELGARVEVISHADHGQSRPCRECPRCREGVKNFFSSLGLLGDDVTSSLSLSDCVILIITGGYIVSHTETEGVAEWLRGLGLRAVAEDIPYTPVLVPGQTATSRDEAWEAARSRVVTGTDEEGRPVIHVVYQPHFLGLERDVVVVWHRDREDEDEDRQGQRDRDWRKDEHRHRWFRAMTRCQGRLLLVAASPSPALSLLPASSPAHGQAKSSSPSSPPSPPPSSPPSSPPSLPPSSSSDVQQERCATQQTPTPHSPPLQTDNPPTSARPPASSRAVSTDPDATQQKQICSRPSQH